MFNFKKCTYYERKMHFYLTTHLTLHFRSKDALLYWYSIFRHVVACSLDVIPSFGVEMLQDK